MWHTAVRLWRGEMPLHTAFWEYAIVYGIAVNILSSGGALITHTMGAPFAITAILFLLHFPYFCLVTVAVWRSASQYPGRQVWADLARTGVTIWALGMVFI